jgi:hypothetical protein
MGKMKTPRGPGVDFRAAAVARPSWLTSRDAMPAVDQGWRAMAKIVATIERPATAGRCGNGGWNDTLADPRTLSYMNINCKLCN